MYCILPSGRIKGTVTHHSTTSYKQWDRRALHSQTVPIQASPIYSAGFFLGLSAVSFWTLEVACIFRGWGHHCCCPLVVQSATTSSSGSHTHVCYLRAVLGESIETHLAVSVAQVHLYLVAINLLIGTALISLAPDFGSQCQNTSPVRFSLCV